MKEIINRKDKIPFTQIANSFIENKDLSLKAKGLFAYLFCKPVGWDFSAERICLENTDGRDSILSGIQELLDSGYLERKKMTNGRIVYNFYIKPKRENPTVGKTQGGKTPPISNKQGESNKQDTIAGASPAWVLEEKLQKMEEKENSAMDIIALFIREKPVVVQNSKQLSAVISRYIRVAQKMEGAYTNDQIFNAVDKIKKDNEMRKRKGEQVVDFTLETVLKLLTK